jgi:CBS domain-containing protein
MKEELFRFLSSHAPFSFLPAEELEKIAASLKYAEYPANTILSIQGQSVIENLYILYEGTLELYFQENSHKTLNGFVSEGETFGGISMLLNDGFAIRTVRVKEKSVLYLLPKEKFLDICERYPEFSDYFTNTFGKRMLDKSYMAIVTKIVGHRNLESMPLLNQNVESISNPVFVTCPKDASIQTAAKLMSERKRSAILVTDGGDKYEGIVTDRDFREKVVAKGLDVSKTIGSIMSSPLIKISSDAPVLEAVLTMIQKGIKHLAVVNPAGKVIGITSNQSLLKSQGQSPVSLISEIRDAGELDQIMNRQSQLISLVDDLVQGGARADHLNRVISMVSDAILLKLINFALNELGAPPAKFVFVVMGSEGRKEQTLKTDQDNAIIFEDVPQRSLKTVEKYFLEFGKKVCGWLDQAGYKYCNGNVMAQNPKWCQPLSMWKGYFRKWIQTPEPMAVMHSTIFFDFVGAYGDLSLTTQLRQYLLDLLGDRARVFFYHLALNSLKMKPPLGFFRNFVVESKGEHRNTFDIKKAMTPIVDFARIYALENRMEATNTQERLHQLFVEEVINEEEYHELVQSYRYLMQVRLVRQVSAITEDQNPPDNYVNPQKLTHIEQKMLKEIFSSIEKYQQKLSVHFTGIA